VHLDVSLHKVTLFVLNIQSVEAAEGAAAKNSQTTQLREEADPLQKRDKTKTGGKK
jgi:hypothetical protein